MGRHPPSHCAAAGSPTGHAKALEDETLNGSPQVAVHDPSFVRGRECGGNGRSQLRHAFDEYFPASDRSAEVSQPAPFRHRA